MTGAVQAARPWRAAFFVAAAAALAAVGWSLWGGGAGQEETPLALSYFLPDGQLLDVQSDPSLALSPDGSLLVYVGEEGRGHRLYVRDLSDYSVRALDGTEGAQAPFFSPDGSSIGFVVDGQMRRMPVSGGIPSPIATVDGQVRGASWSAEGSIVYSLSGSSLWQVSATGGIPEEIPLVLDSASLGDGVQAPANFANTRFPQYLPGGTEALVTSSFSPTTLGVVELASGRFRPIGDQDRATWLPSGHLVFYDRAETVSVVSFDVDARAVVGVPVPVVSDAFRPAGSEARFAVSQSGAMAFMRGGFQRQLVIVDRVGRETAIEAEPRGYRMPATSPDGVYLAVAVDPQPPHIWVFDLLRGSEQPVTSDGYNLSPSWSPEGTRLLFTRNPPDRAGGFWTVWVPWPGGGDPTFLWQGAGGPFDWFHEDSVRLVPGNADIRVLDLESDVERDWLVTPARERRPRTSPDRRWVAYQSDVTGLFEVYVRPADGGPPVTQVSTEGGVEATWSPDGAELYYRDGSAIMAARITAGPEFALVGPPETLFRGNYDFTSGDNWDVMPDGRFVMVRSHADFGREVRILTDVVAPAQRGDDG